MATENKPKSSKAHDTSKKRKQRYLPYNKPVKKGSYPVRPGVQGFFITCDGGRERQAAREAINVIDSFYEELAHGDDSCLNHEAFPNKTLNKKIKFSYSSEDDGNDDDNNDEDDDDSNVEDDQKDEEEGKDTQDIPRDSSTNHEILTNKKAEPCTDDGVCCASQIIENPNENKKGVNSHENEEVKADEPPEKKQRLETDASVCGNVVSDKSESIDKLIEAELKELGDKSKRRFINLDSGCNGVVFVQMRKKDGDLGPKDIVQHMMTSVASTRKHMSRFMLRVLPIEVTCYASEEEITQAIKPLIAQYFPMETPVPYKFAVLYEARANTGIDRMKIINAVAKSVPEPHKVDLNNPDKNIVVQIVKTVCLIGVVEKYKEFSKYNLRQLTSHKA